MYQAVLYTTGTTHELEALPLGNVTKSPPSHECPPQEKHLYLKIITKYLGLRQQDTQIVLNSVIIHNIVRGDQ